MTIEQDIIQWCKTRPAWQRGVLEDLTAARAFDESRLEALVDELLSGKSVTPANGHDLELAPESGSAAAVSVMGLRDVVGVNGLVRGGELSFGQTGLTVVYGNNASGKSGYARILKSATRSLDSEPVLPDVFLSTPGTQSAKIDYKVGTNEISHCDWPINDPLLGQVSFYDERCGDIYLSRDSTLSYRPSALALFDGLIAVCDDLRGRLSNRIAYLNRDRIALALPDGTSALQFLRSITASTTEAEVTSAVTPAPDSEIKLARLLQREATLKGSDPTKEQTRLVRVADKVDTIVDQAESLIRDLGELNSIRSARTRSKEARLAALAASSKTFSEEPLPGVGSETWRRLWEAAREYSQYGAYAGHDFPHTVDGAHCPLCQQLLDGDASDRLARFEGYVRDATEQAAQAAESQFDVLAQRLRRTAVARGVLAPLSAELETVDESLAYELDAWLTVVDEIRRSVIEWLDTDGDWPSALPVLPALRVDDLRSLTEGLRSKAAEVDATEFAAELHKVETARAQVDAALVLSRSEAAIRSEIGRLKQISTWRNFSTRLTRLLSLASRMT